jgi:hypothetical protein
MKSINTGNQIFLAGAVALALAGCSRPGTESIAYPSDAQISAALEAQFQQDPNSAAARELIRTLGGDKGRLRYQINQVIARPGGAFEARYDAVLVMGQPGADSLRGLFATMVPEPERAKLPQASLEAYEGWLRQQAESLKKTSAPQGAALQATLELLGKCYRDQKVGAEVTVMQGLGAVLSPERNGLFAEKLALADTTARCLPS